MINKRAKFCWFFLSFIGFAAAMAALTMLLWNALIPVIFGGITINYLQAVGILILARILFGGFGFHHFGRHAHGHFHSHHDFRQMHDMSKDERKEFIRRHMAGRGFFCEDKDKTPQSEQPEE